eukprot:4692929-Lingulodinium_polyedra.AAC.1
MRRLVGEGAWMGRAEPPPDAASASELVTTTVVAAPSAMVCSLPATTFGSAPLNVYVCVFMLVITFLLGVLCGRRMR